MTERDDRTEETAGSLADVVGIRLRRLQGLLLGHWQRWFRMLGVGITPVQGGILLLIDENPGISQVTLARLMRIEAPTLLQTLRPLLEAGLVRRHRSPHDGRALALYVTKAGKAVTETVASQTFAHEADLLRRLDPEESATLLRLLDKAIGSAEEAVEELALRQPPPEKTGTADK